MKKIPMIVDAQDKEIKELESILIACAYNFMAKDLNIKKQRV